MELEEKFKEAKVPMIVVHFDENFETTYTEEYNLGNFELSKCQIESFARIYCLPFVSIIKIPNMCMSLMNGQNSKISNR